MSPHYNTDFFEWGLKDGNIVHVDNVQNGLSCNCYCPDCGTELVAYNRIGNKVTNHFQHKSISNCRNSYETALHYLAKQIILETKTLTVPDIHYQLPALAQSYHNVTHGSDRIVERQVLKFDIVELEKNAEYFRPDLKCFIGEKVLLIEIAVTHFVDAAKMEKIHKYNIPLLEIDLSNVDRSLHKEKLVEVLHGDVKNMKWVYNPKVNERQRITERKAETVKDFVKKNLRSHKVYGKDEVIYDCPIFKKHYDKVTVQFECYNCDYYVAEYEGLYEIGDEPPKYRDSTLDCVGHKASEFIKVLNSVGVKIKD